MRFFCYQIDILFQFVLNFLDNALWMENRDWIVWVRVYFQSFPTSFFSSLSSPSSASRLNRRCSNSIFWSWNKLFPMLLMIVFSGSQTSKRTEKSHGLQKRRKGFCSEPKVLFEKLDISMYFFWVVVRANQKVWILIPCKRMKNRHLQTHSRHMQFPGNTNDTRSGRRVVTICLL